MTEKSPADRAGAAHEGEARARWREKRTTFRRVYDVVAGTTEYMTTNGIGERAACSSDGARTALSQLVEMGVAERRGTRPVEYRRNESYFRWKRVETLAREHTAAQLREEVEKLLEEDRSFQRRFDAVDPNSISPSVFETADHEVVHDQWDELTRWRSVREDLELLQRAIHHAERTDGDTGTSVSA